MISTMGYAQALRSPRQSDERLLSLDAPRRFGMFWIFGGKEIVLAVLLALYKKTGSFAGSELCGLIRRSHSDDPLVRS